jgi:hypothetical protein
VKEIKTRALALILAGALVTSVAGGVMAAGAADAATPSSLSCASGYNNANTAWFTCSGSGSWEGCGPRPASAPGHLEVFRISGISAEYSQLSRELLYRACFRVQRTLRSRHVDLPRSSKCMATGIVSVTRTRRQPYKHHGRI